MSRHLSPSLLRSIAALALALAPVASGCKSDDDGDDHGHDHDHGDEEVGDPTGATCPQDAGMLTYEEFGKPFMEEYCVRCHSSQLTGAAQQRARGARLRQPGGHLARRRAHRRICRERSGGDQHADATFRPETVPQRAAAVG